MVRKSLRSRRPRGPRRGRSRKQGIGAASSWHVPQIIPTLTLTHRFRYGSGTNSFTGNVTRANLLNVVQMATTATVSARLFNAIRVKEVEIWSSPVALGSAPPSMALEWKSNFAPSTEYADNPMGVNPGHIRSSPPPDASNRWWSIGGSSETEVVFTLSVPANVIIDVTLEMRSFDSSESGIAGDGSAGMTAGNTYAGYLDGRASGKLVPVGFVPIS